MISQSRLTTSDHPQLHDPLVWQFEVRARDDESATQGMFLDGDSGQRLRQRRDNRNLHKLGSARALGRRSRAISRAIEVADDTHLDGAQFDMLRAGLRSRTIWRLKNQGQCDGVSLTSPSYYLARSLFFQVVYLLSGTMPRDKGRGPQTKSERVRPGKLTVPLNPLG